jgi:hypothetical protein
MEDVDGSSGLSRTRHALRSVLSGDLEGSRQRLVHALQKLDYQVISEDSLYARRSARGWAAYYCSFNILEYPRHLTINLRALSPNATLATFDYSVDHFGAFSSKRDRHTLRLEAEAIMALAAQNTTSTVCKACGTNQPDDSRFCRVCGAPNVGGEPAELEVLRLTASARGGHHLITAAVIWAAAPFIAALVSLVLLGTGGAGRFTAALLLAQLANLIILFVVLKHSRASVDPASFHKQSLGLNPSETESTGERGILTPALWPQTKSVTEGTTDLLVPLPQAREKVSVPRTRRDTSPIS